MSGAVAGILFAVIVGIGLVLLSRILDLRDKFAEAKERGSHRLDKMESAIQTERTRISNLLHSVNLSDAIQSSLAERVKNHDDASGGFWRMKNGLLIRIRDMSDSHIANSIKLCEGSKTRAESLSRLKAEQQRRVEDRIWAEKTAGVGTERALLTTWNACQAGMEKFNKAAEVTIEIALLKNTAALLASRKKIDRKKISGDLHSAAVRLERNLEPVMRMDWVKSSEWAK